MNAIQPSKPPLQPVEPRRQVNPRSRRRRHSYRAMVLEPTAKLAVNIVLSTAALTALVQLLHYQGSQLQKLDEVQTQVKLIEGRVNLLQTDFVRDFDPQQAKNVMQEQSNRLDPGQRQVVLLDKAATKLEAPVQSTKR